jgi:hypothetical protein
VHALEQGDEDVCQDWRIGEDSGDIRHHAEGSLELLERRPGSLGRSVDRLNFKAGHPSAPWLRELNSTLPI